MQQLINYFKARKNLTAERPVALEADVLARYYFAKKYCKGKRVLDIGTGFGLGANYLAKNGAKEVIGIDYNEEVVKVAIKHKAKNTRFKAHDALNIGSMNTKFDVILAFEIIEHLPIKRVGEFVMSIYDSLADGGVLLLTTPNQHASASFLGKPYNPYHVKEYTGEELTNLFEKYFAPVSVQGMSCKSISYRSKQSQLERSLVYKISFVLGHYKFVRELLALIPRGLKRSVTGERNLPDLTEKDYELEKDLKNATWLFVIAERRMAKSLPAVSVIIANYNGEKFLPNCIRKVLKTDYPNFEVIVCDDGSADKSIELVKQFQMKDKRLRLLKNRRNMGAAGTRNKAFKKATSELIVFLDNDTEVTKNWIRELVAPLAFDSTIGATQALLLDMNDKSLVQQAGAILMPQTGWSVPFHQWKNYSKIKKHLKPRAIVGVSGALAVRRKVFTECKGFDEKESVYTEDIDFSWRIWLTGYRVLLSPKSVVYHFAKKVDDRKAMNVNYYKIYFHLARNSFRSLLKNYELVNTIRYLAVSIFINLARGVMVLLRRRDMSALLATLKALGWTVSNFEDTLKERQRIQTNRMFSDDFIFKVVFDNRNFVEIYNDQFAQTKLLW